VDVKIFGFKETLKHYQAYHAVEVLVQSFGPLHGGIIGNVPGTGKTRLIYTVTVLLRIIHLAFLDVARDKTRLENEKKHLLSSTEDHNQEDGASCPSGRTKWGIPCPCAKSSFTYRMFAGNLAKTYGITCILAPRNLLSTWIGEWEKIIDVDQMNDLAMKLFVAHGDAGKQESRYRMPVDDADVINMRTHEDQAPFLGRARNTRFIVLTTSHSFQNHLLNRFEAIKTTVTPLAPTPKRRLPRSRVDTEHLGWYLHILLLVRDEFDLEKGEGAKAVGVYNHAVNQSKPQIKWIMSGTPYEKSPGDLTYYLQSMCRYWQWANDPTIAHCVAERCMDLAERFDKILRIGKADYDEGELDWILHDFTAICNTLMIRITEDTVWFDGEKILKLPPCKHRDFNLRQFAAYQDRVESFRAETDQRIANRIAKLRQQWIQGGRNGPEPKSLKNNGITVVYELRLVINFPYLATMLANMPRLKLTDGYAREQGWYAGHQAMMQSAYGRNIDQLAESSVKLAQIRHSIGLRLKETDVFGRPVKQIFGSTFATGALIIYLVSNSLDSLRVTNNLDSI
jgi:hypothetical protein